MMAIGGDVGANLAHQREVPQPWENRSGSLDAVAVTCEKGGCQTGCKQNMAKKMFPTLIDEKIGISTHSETLQRTSP